MEREERRGYEYVLMGGGAASRGEVSGREAVVGSADEEATASALRQTSLQ